MAASGQLTDELIDLLLHGSATEANRVRLGELFLDAFHADVFTSFVAQEAGPYGSPVSANADAELLCSYETHFRHVDWLTPRMRQLGRATAVTLRGSRKDEFAQDFLQRHGHVHGMNYFPETRQLGSIDLRIWRNERREPFTPNDVASLQRLGDLMHRLWPAAPTEPASITPREMDVLRLLATGYSDKAICQSLDMALSTVRTHIKNIFKKTASANRGAAAHWYQSRYGS